MISAYLALTARIILMAFERIVVKKLGQTKGSVEATLLFFGLATIFLFPVAIFIPVPSFDFLPWVILAGSIYSIGFVLYVKSLSDGEVSLVAPLTGLNGVFLLILSALFLNESLGILKILGITLVFLGTSFLERGNILNSLKSLWAYPPARAMVQATFLIAIGRLFDKANSVLVHPITYAFSLYLVISLILLGYLLLQKRTSSALELIKQRPGPALMSGLINAYAYVFLLIALKDIEVSIAEPATSLSLPLAVLLGISIFKEKPGQKLKASLIIVLGVFLLFQ